MSTKTRRRFFTVAACLAAVGVIAWASAVAAREVVASRGRAVTHLNADVLSPAVNAATLSVFLASQEAGRNFRDGQAMPARPGLVYHATLALPEDQLAITTSELAAGVVIARFEATADFAPLGLSAGKSYLWVDAKGPAGNPWRGIMISADGKTRNLLPGFKYTPDSDHSNRGGPLEHARLYCNGSQGCLFFSESGLETSWMRCTQGCCEIHGPCRPPCARSEQH